MSIQGDSRGPLGSAITVNLNAVGDTFVPIPCKQFIPRNITVTNASVTLAGSASTIGVYTAAAAGAAPGLSKFTTGGVEIWASFCTVKLGFTA